MSSDSRVYGGSTTKLTTMDFFKKSYLVYRECGCIAESIKDAKEKNGKPIIIGYVRPVNAKDERIPAYIKRQKDLGIPVGDYLNYALKLEVHLKENFNQTMNIAAYTAAFLLDQGLTPKEGYRIHSFATSAGAIACHRDALNKKPNSFTPLRCEDVIYSGLKKRRIT
jgi:citrate synthase